MIRTEQEPTRVVVVLVSYVFLYFWDQLISPAGASETAIDRRERLRKLALETIDLAKVCIIFTVDEP